MPAGEVALLCPRLHLGREASPSEPARGGRGSCLNPGLRSTTKDIAAVGEPSAWRCWATLAPALGTRFLGAGPTCPSSDQLGTWDPVGAVGYVPEAQLSTPNSLKRSLGRAMGAEGRPTGAGERQGGG